MSWESILLISIALVVLGSCIGSFLNVVVYRLPAGLSLVHPGSFCPRCQNPIRALDNVPVLGWIKLRGRCRDCGQKISARYPLVELAAAILLLASGWTALAQTHWLVGDKAWMIATIYPFGLLATLLCAALIHSDGKPVPLKLFLPALVLAFLIALVWPAVGQSSWASGMQPAKTTADQAHERVLRLLAQICGLGLGTLLAWVIGKAQGGVQRSTESAAPQSAQFGCLGLLGLYWGPSAAGIGTLLLLIFGWLRGGPRRSTADWRFFILLPLAMLFQYLAAIGLNPPF